MKVKKKTLTILGRHVWTLLNVTGRTRIMDHQFGCQYLDNNNKEARLPEEVVGSYYEG